FQPRTGKGTAAPRGILLFGRYDFSLEHSNPEDSEVWGRDRYSQALSWDTAFIKKEHLSRLLLGSDPAAPWQCEDSDDAAGDKGLRDGVLGTASHLEGADDLAVKMGAKPAVLRKLAACITWLRRRAAAYSLSGPERTDYLAVLYLTVLETLQYAHKERERLA